MNRLWLVTLAVAVAGGATSSQAATSSLIVFSANRAPMLSGEIYRVDWNGHRVNLSRSTTYQDTNPLVSPDGRRVAFLSDRSGQEGVYEVGIGGRGLVRVARSAHLRFAPSPGGAGAELAWQPRGGRLAVASADGSDGIWIVRPKGRSAHVRSVNHIGGWASDGHAHGWSPDGRVLAATVDGGGASPDRELMLSPFGRTLWTIRNVVGSSATWSARGLLAVTTGSKAAGARHGIAVYTEARHLRYRIPLGVADTWADWSPDGSRLAVTSGRTLQVRTATGRLLLRKKLNGLQHDLSRGDAVWEGNGHLAVFGFLSSPYPRIIDVRTGKTSPAGYPWGAPTFSADGKRAVFSVPSGSVFWIQVAPTAGGPPKTYTVVPGCDEGADWYGDAGQFQFVPRGRSIIYASICWSPLAQLYSVAADGGAVRQITTTKWEHLQPALSPDGSKIAYSQEPCSGYCEASSDIRVLNVDGSTERVLTNPYCDRYSTWPNGDIAPTWSPDGTTILFSRQDCQGDAPELYTAPASGGPPHDLGIAGEEPAWGPSRIAYVDSASPSGVWTANPDGTEPIRVGDGFSPAWSSNGRLAYLTHPPGTTKVALVNGSTETTLPFASVSSLAWSPAETRLVVTARETKTAPPDVYTIKLNGTDPVRLTDNYGASSASRR